jgi:hypothetical protein
MTDTTPTFSKSLKKTLTTKNQEDRARSIAASQAPEHVKDYYAPVDTPSYTVANFEHDIVFPTEFKSALPSDYRRVIDLYREGRNIHNEHIAGSRFPDDGFDWFNEPEICDFKRRLHEAFADIGKQLAYKKRRLSAYDAQLFLYKNVLSPLDELTWQDGCRLDFLFDKSIDLLAQSYLSKFVEHAFEYPDLQNPFGATTFSFQSICQSPKQANFLKLQLELYNLRDYVVAEKVFDSLHSSIKDNKIVDVLSYEDMLFDVYELLPLYVKSWSPDKQKVELDNEASLVFHLSDGIPTFVLAPTGQTADKTVSQAFRFTWTITGEFICFAKLDCETNTLQEIGNWALSLLHEKLVRLFTLRKPEKKPIPPKHDFYDLADFTRSYHDALDQNQVDDDTAAVKSHNLVPAMRMTPFFTLMEEKFGCSIASGKGSELKIWREDSRIYTIGRHKKEPKMHSFLIRKILKRLGISENDWLAAL